MLIANSCTNNTNESQQTPNKGMNQLSQMHQLGGVVLDTMDAGGYTYIQVEQNGKQFWAAAPETNVVIGEVVSLTNPMTQKNFTSPTLNRTFPIIYFVSEIRKTGDIVPLPEHTDQANQTPPNPSPPPTISFEGITTPEGGMTIEKIYANKAKLENMSVTFRGKVVKYNPNIMGVNWIHVQDGTGKEGTKDITVTSQTDANLNDTVVVTGIVTLNKDFGSGYQYDLIIEHAEVINETHSHNSKMESPSGTESPNTTESPDTTKNQTP